MGISKLSKVSILQQNKKNQIYLIVKIIYQAPAEKKQDLFRPEVKKKKEKRNWRLRREINRASRTRF